MFVLLFLLEKVKQFSLTIRLNRLSWLGLLSNSFRLFGFGSFRSFFRLWLANFLFWFLSRCYCWFFYNFDFRFLNIHLTHLLRCRRIRTSSWSWSLLLLNLFNSHLNIFLFDCFSWFHLLSRLSSLSFHFGIFLGLLWFFNDLSCENIQVFLLFKELQVKVLGILIFGCKLLAWLPQNPNKRI